MKLYEYNELIRGLEDDDKKFLLLFLGGWFIDNEEFVRAVKKGMEALEGNKKG